MGRTFIHRLLNALFKGKQGGNAVSRAKDQAAMEKAGNKAANAGSKANLKGKHQAETEVETEEKMRACAIEIKNCIDLINNTGNPAKSKENRSAKVDDRKADKRTGKRKTSGRNRSDKSMKKSKQGVSPAEMVILLGKAEKKLSKAVVKAKEKEDKKRKEKKNN